MKYVHTLSFLSTYFQTNSLLMTSKASALLLIITHSNLKAQHILEADGSHSVPFTSDLLATS
jgi:hypothetical protein